LSQHLIAVWAGVEQSVNDDAVAWLVTQTYSCLHSSQKRTLWIFTVTKLSQNVLNCNKLCGRPPQYAPPPASWPFDLESGVVESRVTWATSEPILVFLGLSRLRPDVRDRQMSDAHHRLMPPNLGAEA